MNLFENIDKMEAIRKRLITDKNLIEVHVPPSQEALFRNLLTPCYGEQYNSGIALFVSPFGNKIRLVNKDGNTKIMELGEGA